MAALHLRLETNPGDEPSIIEQKMFDILNECLQPSSGLSVSEAALKLNSLFPLHRPEEEEKEKAESFLWDMWGLFLQVAEHIPRDSPAQDKLAELVKALHDLPSETVVNIWGGDCKIWKDLPILGPCMTEEFNKLDIVSMQGGEADMLKERQSWYGLNAFAARLTRDGTCDCQLYAIWAIREGLENKPDHRAETYHVQGPVLDCHVAVAAEWIRQCGRAFYGSTEDFGTAGAGGSQWKGKGGYCKERWQFWKQRFGEIAEEEQVNAQTRQMAQEAEKMMAEVEAHA